MPQRNVNFTGREYLLTELRRHVTAASAFPIPHALYGLAGAGKTQLAIEYAYRNARHYEAIWWIPADNMAVVRSSLAALAPQLGLTGLAPGHIEEAVSAVLSALRRGEPYKRWLIVFDNADLPEQLRRILPIGPGHVIVTTRDRSWGQVVNALEVGVFSRDESTQFLSRRVLGITDEDARRLAEVFGDLPLGLEHAVMWLTQTAITVDSYLELLADRDSRLLAENPGPSDYPAPVAAAWNLSLAQLRSEEPQAMELLRCCSFFGAAPVPLALLERGHLALESPLRQLLNDQIALGRAIRALGRHSLVRVDTYHRTIEVHRVIQRLVRDELDADGYRDVQHQVHMILAAGGPGDPDSIENWPKYSELAVHLGPAEIVNCTEPQVRRLARNMVRYLLITGNHTSALTSADKALDRWTGDSGGEGQDVLIMTRLKIQVLQALARYEEAYVLTRSLLDRMRQALGEDHEQTLILMNCHCIDLWARGEYSSSLTFTEVSLDRHLRVLGDNHPRTFAAMNNYAEDLELNGNYPAASAIHRQLYSKKLDIYGVDHPRTLFSLGALGRTVLAEGRLADARAIAEQAHEGFRQLVRRHVLADGHPWVLQQTVDLSAALRAAGAITEALALAEEAYGRCRRAYFGTDHPRTLAAAVNLGNAQRVAGDTQSARRLLDDTAHRYAAVFGRMHPYALACDVDLAVASRRIGDVASARRTLETTARSLAQQLGQNHHHSLICLVNLASALADADELDEAVRRGEAAVEGLGSLLGQDHPHALMCAVNLLLDLTAAGQEQRIAELGPGLAERCRDIFGHEHPVIRAISAGDRLDLEAELHATF